jgi:hypothetical protein
MRRQTMPASTDVRTKNAKRSIQRNITRPYVGLLLYLSRSRKDHRIRARLLRRFFELFHMIRLNEPEAQAGLRHSLTIGVALEQAPRQTRRRQFRQYIRAIFSQAFHPIQLNVLTPEVHSKTHSRFSRHAGETGIQ